MTPRSLFIGMMCGLAFLVGCAGSKPVSFSVTRPPLLGTAPVKVIACLGFGGEDVEAGARVESRLLQLLAVSGTYTVVPPGPIRAALGGHSRERIEMTDTLALAVGRAVRADVVLLGQVTSAFTEWYGEEKKFRNIEVATTETLPRRGATKLVTVPYWEPFVLQTASLEATIRGLSVETGREVGMERMESRNAFRIPLPVAVEDAPKKPTIVKRVNPQLVDVTATELARKLVESLSWHPVSFTRYVKRGVRGGDEGLIAALKGEWDRALAIWERAVREAPNSPGAWNNVAIAYEQAGRLAEARQAYDRALALQPGDPVIRKNQTEGW
ncbi:MAG: tetratricopeptide repeat protein [Candidatus Latescibacteria bacterium]|nr:tetratricopeptide repeat protein [Candidatus Latescibacterota bacterium]